MIREINPLFGSLNNNSNVLMHNKKQKCAELNITSDVELSQVNLESLQAYNSISFKSSRTKRNGDGSWDKLRELEDNFTLNAEAMLENAKIIAKKYNSPEVNQLHVFRVGLDTCIQYIDDLNSGKAHFSEKSQIISPLVFNDIICKDVFSKQELRDKIRPAFVNAQKEIDTYLEANKNDTPPETKDLRLAKDYVNDMYNSYSEECSESRLEVVYVSDATLLDATIDSTNPKIDPVIAPIINKLQAAIMLDKKDKSNTTNISLYDSKAKNIWENIALGKDMFVVHEEGNEPDFLVNSFARMLENSGQLGKHNKKNTEILISNKYLKEDFLIDTIIKAGRNPDKNYIFVFDYNKMLENNIDAGDEGMDTTEISLSLGDVIMTPPKNVRFVTLIERDSFYSMPALMSEKTFGNFGDVSFSPMTVPQAKQVLKTEKELLKKINKPFSPAAIDKCVEAVEKQKGFYPEKALKLMKRVATANIGKKVIMPNDVAEFLKNTLNSTTTKDDKNSVIMLDNTGVKLKDLLGSQSSKEEAAAIIKAIKNKSLGTNGFVIYSQDGYPGSGRKFTAQAIAGEAKIPYIGIDTTSFGTKDVDLLGYGILSPDKSMKKLWSDIKDRAENNPRKAAVLFIENFEYFSAGEYVSEYHQKAMSQMLREMDLAEKQGFNIAVIGSVTNPDMIDDTTLKSAKFSDKIEIESPARDMHARSEIIHNYIKKNRMEIEGTTPEEKENIIRSVAITTQGFPFINILTFMKKAQIVAKERGHKAINLSDFTEAYLRTTVGRHSSRKSHECDKAIVTSHECGHAVTTQVMYDAIKSTGKPWCLPSKVNFITLDARSYYGGAMYPYSDETDNYTIENIIAELVSCFGGNSAEKTLYDFDGSWGISCDMGMATRYSEMAIKYMGMGPNTGKRSFYYYRGGHNPSTSSVVRRKIDKDVDLFLKNSSYISDKILTTYKDYVHRFTEKYKGRVGSGQCLILGEEFERGFKEWKAAQSPEKRAELDALNKEILKIIENTKQGKIVKSNK